MVDIAKDLKTTRRAAIEPPVFVCRIAPDTHPETPEKSRTDGPPHVLGASMPTSPNPALDGLVGSVSDRALSCAKGTGRRHTNNGRQEQSVRRRLVEAGLAGAGQATASTGLLKKSAHGNPLTMQNIDTLFKAAKSRYDSSQPSLAECFDVTRACLQKLNAEANLRYYGEFRGVPNIEYWVAEGNGNLSRPYRPELFISDIAAFEAAAVNFQDQLDDDEITDPVTFERVIYTVVSSFCLCYDVWKPKSRKTPGTFFEVLVGSICYVRYPTPAFRLTKHIPITVEVPADADAEGDEALQGNSVSTDLVITNSETHKAAVIPLKITTRERIVQPFAHQRILDSAYPDRFRSYLTCISEVQRDDNTTSVKQICVPGTVALFQKHLSELSGLYYCDIPQRYARQDFTALIRVTGIANLFDDMDDWLDR